MKRICLVVSLSFMILLFSFSLFASMWLRSTGLYTYRSSIAVTNLAMSPCQLGAISCKYVTPATGTFQVAKIRNASTNVMVTVSLAGTTNLFISSDEFAGMWIQQNEIIRISDSSAVTGKLEIAFEEPR